MSLRSMVQTCALGCALLGSTVAVGAEGEFSLFGSATVISGDRPRDRFLVVQSDADATVPYGGVSWEPKSRRRGSLLLQDLEHLSATYRVYQGGVGLGSPRFSIAVDTDYDGDADGNIFVYLGDPPNFTAETSASFQSSGNLLAGSDLRVDSTQLGGEFYGTFDDALELAAFGEVLSVDFVVDAGYAFDDGLQAVIVTDIQVNNDNINLRKLD